MRVSATPTNEKRTNPDFVVHLPKKSRGPDGYGDHFLVESTPGGDLLAMWTMSAIEGALNSRVVVARSEDEGRTWSAPENIVGALSAEETQAAFAIPVMSRSGRIYCLYNVDIGIYDAGPRISAVLGCHVSDDDGRTWQDSGIEIPYGRTKYDHPDPKVPCNCIIWQKPVRDANGRPMAPFTRGSSLALYPRTPPDWNFMTRSGTAARGGDGHGGLMRFENIDDGPEPADIEITWLPREDGALSFPNAMELARAHGYSCFHEPSVAIPPDGRLFVAASSLSGHLIYTVSDDADATGRREAEPLRYRNCSTGWVERAMSTIDSIALDEQLSAPQFLEDPYPLYHRLRSVDPVHWSDAWHCWLLTRYDDENSALRDPKRVSNVGTTERYLKQLPAEALGRLQPLYQHFTAGMVRLDPPEHTPIRNLTNKSFTPRVVESLRSRIQNIVDQLIDAFQARARFDLVSEFAYPAPARAFAGLIGFPLEDCDRFKAWSVEIAAFHGTGRWPPTYSASRTVRRPCWP